MSEPMFHENMRPKKFEDVFGNKDVIESIKKLITPCISKGKFQYDKKPGAMLLHGISGVGKTTLARIIANEMGGNVVTINASSDSGVEAVRKLSVDIKEKPLLNPLTVYIIDEVQGMTKNAQNAFLIPMEDLPPYAYIILCTTNPEKLIKTILTRCISFHLKPLGEEDMMRYSAFLIKKYKEAEKVDNLLIESDNGLMVQLEAIKRSGGSPRMYLNLFDKIKHTDDMGVANSLMGSLTLGEAESGAEFKYAMALLNGLTKCHLPSIQSTLQSIKKEEGNAGSVNRILVALIGNALIRGDLNKVGWIRTLDLRSGYNVHCLTDDIMQLFLQSQNRRRN